MPTVEALRVDVLENLLPLSALLHERGIAHRIFEDAGQQVLEVADPEHRQQVQEIYRKYSSGELQIEIVKKPTPVTAVGATPIAPVTLALIGCSILGFLVIYLRAPIAWLSALTYTPFELVEGQPVFSSGEGQYWRLVTPVFLHFGWLHIAFNSLWTWELGRRAEWVIGPLQLLLLFLVIAVVSNVAQFMVSGPALFGGMSGVVYGLLGFNWVAGKIRPDWPISPGNGVMIFMVGWLLFCMAGVVEMLGFGAIANAAHLGGLLSGLALGAALALLSPPR